MTKPGECETVGVVADDKLRVPIAVFQAYRFCDDESCRYALGGINFETDPDGQHYAVATDGRRLIALTWKPTGTSLNAIVSGRAFESACREIESQGRIAEYGEVSATSVAITDNSGSRRAEFHEPAVEGRFPKWRDLFPEAKPYDLSVFIDARYLRDALDALLAVFGKDDRAVTLTVPHDHRGNVLLSKQAENGARACVVVISTMANSDGSKATGPEWMPKDAKHNE